MGYEVTGILPQGEEALVHVAENKLGIILLAVNLKGTLDGIATAERLQQAAESERRRPCEIRIN